MHQADPVLTGQRQPPVIGADDQQLLGPEVDMAQQERQYPLADATETKHDQTAGEALFGGRREHVRLSRCCRARARNI
ncbi:hypothetical protein D3C87_1884380 [compost metagenome]